MSLLDQFASRRLLVLGDVILDRYWWGESTRLSPEAPVPVVRRLRSTVRAGGAANTAANLVALGATADLIGVVGADAPGAELREVIRGLGIGEALVEDAGRPTTSKTRIIALHQQVVRVDEEETTALPDSLMNEVAGRVGERLGAIHALVLSDYAKGFLTPALTRRVIEAARAGGVPIYIDPKGANYRHYVGCTLLKPNRLELGILVQSSVRNHQETVEAGRHLRSLMPGSSILVTEGADGMTLFAEAGEEHVESILRQVFDVTGAGDTVLAAVALALTAGASAREALDLASRAASIVVGEIGTATVTRAQLEGSGGRIYPMSLR
jgi:D-glycero-beta-D-manno-heptose-7-phosphate kinase